MKARMGLFCRKEAVPADTIKNKPMRIILELK
jgi:hypothetical protein